MSPEGLSASLARAPNWHLSTDGRHIERVVECRSFAGAIAFVGRVSLLAEAASHHPVIEVCEGRVRLVLTTRSAGGLTERDVGLASWVDRVVP